MKKVTYWGLGLVLIAFDLCLGVQREVVKITKIASNGATIRKLEYHVTMLQDSFLLYNPVAIWLGVRNLGPDTAQVWFDATAGWVLHDQSGRSYSSTVAVDYAAPRIIQPGDSIGSVTSLSDYGITIPGPFTSPALPVGEYKVYYKIEHDSTPPFTFKVVEPKGEEGKALALYLDAFSPTSGDSFFQTKDKERVELLREHANRLLQVVDRYPKSVYAIDAVSRALSTAWDALYDRKLAFEINARIIRDFPDSRLNGIGFFKAYYGDDRAAYRATLDSIIKVNPHPKVTAAAKQALKDLKKENK